MCYDYDARPPLPPIAGGAAQGEDLVLTAADGNRFMAYMARTGSADGAQIVIYPDVRGLHPFYKDLAVRFAEVGVNALAIDYFGRTAGVGARDESFEYMPHVQQMQMPSFFEDVKAALAYLRRDGGAKRATFVVGFCMGGSLSLLTGTEPFDPSGLIAFYAGLSRARAGSRGTPLELADQIHYPVLGMFGGADPGIPVSEVEQLDKQLDKAGVEHEIVIYPGAPHSFFDRKYEEFAEASADAWRRMLNFVDTHKKK
jgi:carboxymethylenebutenolidase